MDKEAEPCALPAKGIAGGDGIAVSTSESAGAGMGFSGLDVSIQGENQEDLANTTRQLVAQLQGVNGLANLESDLTMVVPRLDIKLDPARWQLWDCRLSNSTIAAGILPSDDGEHFAREGSEYQ